MPEPRQIAVLTTGRQDYGILRSTIRLMADDARFRLCLWVGGMHLQARFGKTIDLIRADGVRIDREIDFLCDPPNPHLDASRALSMIGDALEIQRPEALMVLGDRSETLAAGLAATIARVPLIHLHGGEESEGAIDNACRHALTKLAHLHLVSHQRHAERVVQMGEDPATVVVVGAPGIDNLYRTDLPTRLEVARTLGRDTLPDPIVLVTLHPATLGEQPMVEATALSDAMERVPATYIITQPNSDAGGAAIAQHWVAWARGRRNAIVTEALGEQRYWAVLREAAAVVGNSSSAIIEAPAAGVTAINIGDRQRGRLRFGRVHDVPANAEAIAAALSSALEGGRTAADIGYLRGPAAPRVVDAIARWSPEIPPRKPFYDTPCAATASY